MQTILRVHPRVEKEDVLMQRRRRGRYVTEQANLFHRKRSRPAWEALPLESREEVTKRVAQMLRAHQARQVASADAEVQHD